MSAQYALEADPGRCTASFPTFDTLEAAATAASFPAMDRRTRGVSPPRVLVRLPGCAWQPVPLPVWWCPLCDGGVAWHACTCVAPTALDFPNCWACQMWQDAGASWPRPCAEHYRGEPR